VESCSLPVFVLVSVTYRTHFYQATTQNRHYQLARARWAPSQPARGMPTGATNSTDAAMRFARGALRRRSARDIRALQKVRRPSSCAITTSYPRRRARRVARTRTVLRYDGSGVHIVIVVGAEEDDW